MAPASLAARTSAGRAGRRDGRCAGGSSGRGAGGCWVEESRRGRAGHPDTYLIVAGGFTGREKRRTP